MGWTSPGENFKLSVICMVMVTDLIGYYDLGKMEHVYTLNKRVPWIDPCGTQHVNSVCVDA